jgi:hypothetical protein
MSEAAMSKAPFCRSSVLSFGSDTAGAIYQIRLLFATRKSTILRPIKMVINVALRLPVFPLGSGDTS